MPKSTIHEKVSLKPYNTFNIDVIADYWFEVYQPEDILLLISTGILQSRPYYILGGGSNVLFADNYPGIIIKNNIPGIEKISEDPEHVFIRAGAGVVWDKLVTCSLNNNWGGLENLSMIPGLTGAAPIQNIGAYGVEFEEKFVSLEAVHLQTGKTEYFDKKKCRFGYRDSIFKRSVKGEYIISYVTMRLDKDPTPYFNYGNLKDVLHNNRIEHPTIHDISQAVRNIRSSKLPDPTRIGNAGSFFKNPVVTRDFYDALQLEYPELPGFIVKNNTSDSNTAESHNRKTFHAPHNEKGHNNQIKIPAAWLIEQCGFRGKKYGDAGVHQNHALILVNFGKATGQQLIQLAHTIQTAVYHQFGILLETEVNIIQQEY